MICCEQEKLAIKEKKEADEAKFKYAQVDGRTEQVRLLNALQHVHGTNWLHVSSYLATSSCYASPISIGRFFALFPQSHYR